MRSAYSGYPGYQNQGAPFDSGPMGHDQGGERLSQIRRSIEAIEQRLMNAAAPVAGYGQPVAPSAPQPMPYGHMAAAAPTQQIYAAPQQPMHPMPTPPAAYQPAMAHAPMGNAAAEIAQRQQVLNANTANLSAQVNTAAGIDGIGQQLSELKSELAGVRSQVSKPIAVPQSVPQEEVDRIAKAVADLQSRNNPTDETVDRLTQELDQLRNAMNGDMRSALQKGVKATVDSQTASLTKQLDALSKEVRSAIRSEVKGQSSQQSGDLAKRLDALSQGINEISVNSANAVGPRVDNLSTQLDSLRMTIDDLPQTLSISRIEDRLNELGDRIAKMADEAGRPMAESPGEVTPHVTPEEFLSIEKRLDEIARALVAVSNTGRKAPKLDLSGIDRVEARMTELARTLDVISEQSESANLEKLAVRIEGLTERLASFEKYAESGDLGGASAMFAAPDTGIIEDQLRALNSRLDEVAAQPATQSIEEQIRHLSQQVEAASNVHSTAAQMSNLEAQIGQILRQMDGMGGAAPVDFTPVEARLGQIEHQLQANQNFSLEAAQQAAQHAVAMMGPQSEGGSVIEALAHDLKSLQLLAEGNAAQSAQSIQQIQSTLHQVMDRLGTIENTHSDEPVRQATVVQGAPLAMPSDPGTAATAAPSDPVADPALETDGLVNAAIADQDLSATHADDPAADDKPVAHVGATPSAPSAPENMPLEPGSAVPNIDDLVQRASEQLNETHAQLAAAAAGGNDAAEASEMKQVDERSAGDLRPDAVAAARRALQATTAEMTAVRNEVDVDAEEAPVKSGKSKLLSSLPSFDTSKFRRPLVLGAAALLLAIVAFKGIGIFTGSNTQPVAQLNAPAIEKTIENPTGSDTLTAQDRSEPSSSIREVGTGAPTSPVMEQNVAVTEAPASPPKTVGPEVSVISPNISSPNTDVATKPSGTDGDTLAVTPTAIEQEPVEEPIELSSTPAPQAPKKVFDVSAESGPAALVAAASAGDAKALFQVGMRYSDGEHVTRNMTEAAKWFLRSAEAGFAPAQYSIGSLFEKGIGVERDVSKATGWYEKAALQGNARAMHNLAVIYAMGNPPSVQPNMDAAVDWFKKAAQLGIKDSQFNLGILYGQGMGVPQNLVDSYKWFALAAKTGDTDANKKRDEVANAMDPDDLDFARQEVNNWAPAKLKESVNRVAVPEEWRGPSASGKSAAKAKPSNDFVKQAQSLLNQRGFHVGEPDGLIGPKTKRAIMEFQRSAGIPVTGEVDQKLLQALDLQT